MMTLSKVAARVAGPIMSRAARAYIAGPELSDGLRVATQMEQRGFASTLGFWDGDDDSPRSVADAYVDALKAMRQRNSDCYLSIKLPALAYSLDLLDEVLAEARLAKARIHFDSLGPETVDQTCSIVEKLDLHANRLSVSLPGRWHRSLRDAEWATELRLGIRVVKGQWADDSGPQIDPHAGFLNLVKHASQCTGLAIATHDPRLAAECLDAMVLSQAKAEIELLFGLPSRSVLYLAKKTNSPVRIYVPYGHAWLPYCMARAQKNPRIFWWMLKDSVLARGAGI
jgi:proline dehydrogenase